MALTRKMLAGMGLSEEQIESIITEHTAVTTSLKDKADELQTKLDGLGDVQKKLDELEKSIEKDDWKGRYEKEHKDFEAFKKDTEGKETTAKLKSAYKKLLTEAKVGDKQIDSILKVTDFSAMKLTEDGNLENAEELKKNIATDWAGFIQTTETKPHDNPENPPAGNGNSTVSNAGKLARQYYEEKYGKIKED